MQIKEAYDYIDSLPDHRLAAISIHFSRLEDRRRAAIPLNRHQEYLVVAHCKLKDNEITDGCRFFMVKCINTDYELALDEAVSKLKQFLG